MAGSNSTRQDIDNFFEEYDGRITLADKERKRQIMVDRMPEPDVPKRRRMGSEAPIHVSVLWSWFSAFNGRT